VEAFEVVGHADQIPFQSHFGVTVQSRVFGID
jgi:hypothetical protein